MSLNMIIAYKNYKRTERVELCIKSVRHFMPNIDIHLMCLFDETPEEYSKEIEHLKQLKVKINFEKNKHKKGPGCNSKSNGFYYTEYLNYFSKLYNNETKVLAMDEDMYFTSGETLKWIKENDFDLACGDWWMGPNAAILGINFKNLNHLFPLSEKEEYVEKILQQELVNKAIETNACVKKIPTRSFFNYFNDGAYTNSTEEIKNHLISCNII